MAKIKAVFMAEFPLVSNVIVTFSSGSVSNVSVAFSADFVKVSISYDTPAAEAATTKTAVEDGGESFKTAVVSAIKDDPVLSNEMEEVMEPGKMAIDIAATGSISVTMVNPVENANQTTTTTTTTELMMEDFVDVSGAVSQSFPRLFVRAVARATGCKTSRIVVLRVASVGQLGRIARVVFRAPAVVVEAVREQAEDPGSKLSRGALAPFLNPTPGFTPRGGGVWAGVDAITPYTKPIWRHTRLMRPS